MAREEKTERKLKARDQSKTTEQRAKEYFDSFYLPQFGPWPRKNPWPVIEVNVDGLKINDLFKFLNSHHLIARRNWKKRVYSPYLERLDAVKKWMEKNEIDIIKLLREHESKI